MLNAQFITSGRQRGQVVNAGRAGLSLGNEVRADATNGDVRAGHYGPGGIGDYAGHGSPFNLTPTRSREKRCYHNDEIKPLEKHEYLRELADTQNDPS